MLVEAQAGLVPLPVKNSPGDCQQTARGWRERRGADPSSAPLEGAHPAGPLVLGFWPPEPRENTLLSFWASGS